MMDGGASKQRKALLIFPTAFYSFTATIVGALSTKGYDVVVANDEYPNNILGKLLGNLRLFWPLSLFTSRVLYRDYLANKRYDLVLIFKGRGLSSPLLTKVRNAAGRVVAYNFDAFDYNPSPLRWYKLVDRYCTFDYVDSKSYSLPLVELFSSVPADVAPKSVQYDISAILRNHSNRLQYLNAIVSSLKDAKFYIYILELNVVTFALNFLRNPFLYMKFWRSIHYKALPYADYAKVLRNSEFTVDYAHPSQSGTTIRCFEALSAQTKIITNNGFVTQHNRAFTEHNTIVFDGSSQHADALRERIESMRGVIPARYHRTVSEFIFDLLNDVGQ